MPLNLHRQTLHRLGEAIVAGQYPPGMTMPPEPRLCAQMGVSRTVLREVVKSLVAKGLLSTGPKVGTRVLVEDQWSWLDSDVLAWKFRVGLSLEFLRTITELRQVVEPACVRLAAQRAAPEQLTEIKHAFSRMQQAVLCGEDDLSDDVRFHHLLLQASGNRLLGQMSRLLRALLRAGHDLLGRRPAVTDHKLPWHSAVVDALLARDAFLAEQAMVELINAVEEDLRRHLQQHSAPAFQPLAESGGQ